MSKRIGLAEAEIVAILSEAIQAGKVFNAEEANAAIAKAIVKNNEAIAKQVTELVSGELVKGLNRKGVRL